MASKLNNTASTATPTKQCPYCHADIPVLSKKSSIRKHILQCAPDKLRNNDQTAFAGSSAFAADHLGEKVGAALPPLPYHFRCALCPAEFDYLSSYYQHREAKCAASDHPALEQQGE